MGNNERFEVQHETYLPCRKTHRRRRSRRCHDDESPFPASFCWLELFNTSHRVPVLGGLTYPELGPEVPVSPNVLEDIRGNPEKSIRDGSRRPLSAPQTDPYFVERTGVFWSYPRLISCGHPVVVPTTHLATKVKIMESRCPTLGGGREIVSNGSSLELPWLECRGASQCHSPKSK